MNQFELEYEEEKLRAEQRRIRIEHENQLIRKKIAKNNEIARKNIERDFKRKCRAVAARERELRERGIRLSAKSPFHNDEVKLQKQATEAREWKERKAKERLAHQKKLDAMIGEPEFDPIDDKIYKSLDPETQLAIDIRRVKLKRRILTDESIKLNQMSQQSISKTQELFPIVAMEVNKNLDKILDPLGLKEIEN